MAVGSDMWHSLKLWSGLSTIASAATVPCCCVLRMARDSQVGVGWSRPLQWHCRSAELRGQSCGNRWSSSLLKTSIIWAPASG